MTTACLIAFISGAVTEGICAKWVWSVANGQAVLSAALSMGWATALLLGLGEAMRSGVPAACWVIGYGTGSYLAVRIGGRNA